MGIRGSPLELQEFKKGPFHMALEARVPLQPTRIVGWEKMIEPGSRIPRPGTIEIRFGREIVPAADDGADDLLGKARIEMERLLGEATAE